MSLLINIRGAPAAGKTTTVKSFCERNKAHTEVLISPLRDKLPVSVIDFSGRKNSVIVLGDYNAKGNCLGTDRYNNGSKDIIEAIVESYYRYYPDVIIYEHMLSSHLFRSTKSIIDIAEVYGFDYLGIQLALSDKKRADNMRMRNKKSILPKHFDKQLGVNRSTQMLQEAGFTVVVENVDNIRKEDMWRILDDRVRKAFE